MKFFAFTAAVLVVAGGLLLDPVSLLLDRVERASPDVLFHVPITEPVVALTIDDGPSPSTDSILATLARYDAHATFFLIGEHVRRDTAGVRRIVDAGHEIGHHMRTDESSIRLSDERFAADFRQTEELLQPFGGTHWFRPGSGWYDDAMVAEVTRRGYRLVLGDVYPFDAQVPIRAFAEGWVLDRVRPGSIIVLHDGAARGLRTAAVLRAVLSELTRRGYRVVSLGELTGRG